MTTVLHIISPELAHLTTGSGCRVPDRSPFPSPPCLPPTPFCSRELGFVRFYAQAVSYSLCRPLSDVVRSAERPQGPLRVLTNGRVCFLLVAGKYSIVCMPRIFGLRMFICCWALRGLPTLAVARKCCGERGISLRPRFHLWMIIKARLPSVCPVIISSTRRGTLFLF